MRKAIALFLSTVFSLTNIVFAHKPQENLWSDRKERMEIASLPQPMSANPNWGSVSDLRSSILEHVPSAERKLSPELTSLAQKQIESKTTGASALPAEILAHVSIRGSYQGKGNRQVLLLEDVHKNLEAQQHMSQTIALLGHMKGKTPVMVGLEAASGEFIYDQYQALPEAKIGDMVADSFLESNDISGPAHAGFTFHKQPGDRGLAFWGIDDAKHYVANVDAYKQSHKSKAKTLASIEKLEKEISAQKKSTLNAELLAFDNQVAKHHRGELEFGDYMTLLADKATDVPFSVETFLNAYKAEKSLDFDRAEAERVKVLTSLVNGLSKAELQKLYQLSLGYQQGIVSFGGYYQHLNALCANHGIDLNKTANFKNYVQYVLLSDGIKAEELIKNANVMEDSIYASLTQTAAEKSLIADSRHLVLAKNLVGFGLTSEEWSTYQASKKTFSQSLDLAAYEKFYSSADARNDAMVQNTLDALEVRTVREVRNKSDINVKNKISDLSDLDRTSRTAVIVVGGYHTKGLSALLRQQNISYSILTPKLTKIEEGSAVSYLSVFDREQTKLDKLFAGKKLFLNDTPAGAITALRPDAPSTTPEVVIERTALTVVAANNVSAGDVFRAILKTLHIDLGQISLSPSSRTGSRTVTLETEGHPLEVEVSDGNGAPVEQGARTIGNFKTKTNVKSSFLSSVWSRVRKAFSTSKVSNPVIVTMLAGILTLGENAFSWKFLALGAGVLVGGLVLGGLAEFFKKEAGKPAFSIQGTTTERVPEKDLESKIKFGTAGWRAGFIALINKFKGDDSTAKLDLTFTMGNVSRLAQAIANYYFENNMTGRIAIGFDARPNGREFAQRMVEILVANGIYADLIDQVTPTPIMAEATRKGGDYTLAVHITASHNPKWINFDQGIAWQGVKILQNGLPGEDKLTSAIAKLANEDGKKETFKHIAYSEIPENISQRNVDLIAKSNERLRKAFNFEALKQKIAAYKEAHPEFAVLMDSMHGSTSGAAAILRELGIVSDHLRTSPMYLGEHPEMVGDASYAPDPTNPAMIVEFNKLLKSGMLGFLYDGDGDRAVAKDVNGRVLTPNELGLIKAHYLHSIGETGSIVRTLPTTRLLDRLARKIGAKLIETPVGSKNFAPYADDTLVAVEESGHIFFKKNGELFADSAIAEALLLIEIVVSTGKSLEQYLNEIKAEIGNLEYNRTAVDKKHVTPEFKDGLVDLRANRAKEFAVYLSQLLGKDLLLDDNKDVAHGFGFDITDPNGILVRFADDTWAMYRLSGTDGSVRIYGEESTRERLAHQEKIVQQLLLDLTQPKPAVDPSSYPENVKTRLAIQGLEKQGDLDLNKLAAIWSVAAAAGLPVVIKGEKSDTNGLPTISNNQLALPLAYFRKSSAKDPQRIFDDLKTAAARNGNESLKNFVSKKLSAAQAKLANWNEVKEAKLSNPNVNPNDAVLDNTFTTDLFKMINDPQFQKRFMTAYGSKLTEAEKQMSLPALVDLWTRDAEEARINLDHLTDEEFKHGVEATDKLLLVVELLSAAPASLNVNNAQKYEKEPLAKQGNSPEDQKKQDLAFFYGKFMNRFFQAGAWTRGGLDIPAGLVTAEVLAAKMLDDKGNPAPIDMSQDDEIAKKLPMMAAYILTWKQEIERIAKEYNLPVEVGLASQEIMFSVSDNNAAEIEKYLVQANFFGFPSYAIKLVQQRADRGYRYTPSGVNVNQELAGKSVKQPYGHLESELRFNQATEAYFLTPEGKRVVITAPLHAVQALDGRIQLHQQISNIHGTRPGWYARPEATQFFMKHMIDGKTGAVLTFAINDTKDKGGFLTYVESMPADLVAYLRLPESAIGKPMVIFLEGNQLKSPEGKALLEKLSGANGKYVNAGITAYDSATLANVVTNEHIIQVYTVRGVPVKRKLPGDDKEKEYKIGGQIFPDNVSYVTIFNHGNGEGMADTGETVNVSGKETANNRRFEMKLPKTFPDHVAAMRSAASNPGFKALVTPNMLLSHLQKNVLGLAVPAALLSFLALSDGQASILAVVGVFAVGGFAVGGTVWAVAQLVKAIRKPVGRTWGRATSSRTVRRQANKINTLYAELKGLTNTSPEAIGVMLLSPSVQSVFGKLNSNDALHNAVIQGLSLAAQSQGEDRLANLARLVAYTEAVQNAPAQTLAQAATDTSAKKGSTLSIVTEFAVGRLQEEGKTAQEILNLRALLASVQEQNKAPGVVHNIQVVVHEYVSEMQRAEINALQKVAPTLVIVTEASSITVGTGDEFNQAVGLAAKANPQLVAINALANGSFDSASLRVVDPMPGEWRANGALAAIWSVLVNDGAGWALVSMETYYQSLALAKKMA